jgi:hypothetical protein
MSDVLRRLIILAVVAGLAAELYYWLHTEKHPAVAPLPAPAETQSTPPQAPPAGPQPLIRFPVPAAPQEEPLPPLDESDGVVKEKLSGLIGSEPFLALLVPKDIIQRVVVTIDNLPKRRLPQQYLVFKPLEGRFRASGEEGNQFISGNNYRRYTSYVKIAEAVDTDKLVALYRYLYPLFQTAYRDLGYPSGNFNDRVIEAIDDLLDAPDVRGPVKVVQPGVYYRFADPDLEARSAGQKILLRMGPDNAARIKARLRTLRNALTHLSSTHAAQ